MTNTYVNPRNIDKDTLLSTLSSGSTEAKCEAIVSAVHTITDYEWLVFELTKLTKNVEIDVRGAAVTCIGHLAMLDENANRSELINILEPLLADDQIRGRVEDAIEDVDSHFSSDQ